GRAMRQLHGAKADCRHLCAVCCEGKCFWRLHRKLSRTWRWNVGADKLLSNVDLHGSYDAFPMRHFVSLPGFGIGERLVWDEIEILLIELFDCLGQLHSFAHCLKECLQYGFRGAAWCEQGLPGHGADVGIADLPHGRKVGKFRQTRMIDNCERSQLSGLHEA